VRINAFRQLDPHSVPLEQLKLAVAGMVVVLCCVQVEPDIV
jgi:hypothetical protein